ncbi:hypothetical protein AXG93_4485s1050 [Marchantia polymorpha subsp. ruderalis]|uniref:CCHC-type domain-containing protein n=1 Tax=Marchantia polymorpha subsp. ruderalis TaxID=1480154 RepID=A0A176WF95_MARPO|nr:hypothetical protein AXG93_4485s1050 [Marchantia polymorpha subsp. ruderalis]
MQPKDEIAVTTDGAVEQEILSFSRPFTSSTALTVIRGQSQPSGQDNLQRTGFKRQRSRSPERRRVHFQVPSPNKRNLKNLVCWRCGKNGHIKKDCRMQIKDANLPQVANVAEHLHSEEEDVFTDGL